MATKKRNAPDGSNKRGGGGSRAAKKRAKKKEKQSMLLKTENDDYVVGKEKEGDEIIMMMTDEDVETKLGKEAVPSKSLIKKKNKKKHLPLGDDEEEEDGEVEVKVTVSPLIRKNRTIKIHRKLGVKDDSLQLMDDKNNKQDEDDDCAVGRDNNEEREKMILDQFLSHLTPAQILFPEKFQKDKLDEEGDDKNTSHETTMMLMQQQSDPLEIVSNLTTEKRANRLFKAIIAPSGLSTESFYEHYWEKKPLLISTSENLAEPDSGGVIYGDDMELEGAELEEYKKRFDGFLSKKSIRKLISDFPMKYGKDLNVTNYCDSGIGGKRRITLDQLPNDMTNEDVEYINAESNDVWSNFKAGCTVRLLCPQKHNDEVHSLLSNLEHEFGCMVGSNAYLTPGGTTNQGFAPHYDDIEAFILQLEGYKHWRVYAPMSKEEILPRESSRDFTEEEMKDVEPVIDVVLGPGDLLYMPRGWIHQANTCKGDHHSLHLTVSAMQNWSWVDLLEIVIPDALQKVSTSKSSSLRTGLPKQFLKYMGTMYDVVESESEVLKQLQTARGEEDGDEQEAAKEEVMKQKRLKELQDAFKAEAKKKIMRVCKEALSIVTDGCDEIAKRFLSDRLPPAFTPMEAALTSENRAETGGKIFPNTMVRLAKPGLARLVVEDGKAIVYHSLDNSRVYHETPLSPLEFEIDDAPALETLLTTVEPHWVCVQDLIHGDIEDKMEIAQALYDEGILAMFQDCRPDRSVQTG